MIDNLHSNLFSFTAHYLAAHFSLILIKKNSSALSLWFESVSFFPSSNIHFVAAAAAAEA